MPAPAFFSFPATATIPKASVAPIQQTLAPQKSEGNTEASTSDDFTAHLQKASEQQTTSDNQNLQKNSDTRKEDKAMEKAALPKADKPSDSIATQTAVQTEKQGKEQNGEEKQPENNKNSEETLPDTKTEDHNATVPKKDFQPEKNNGKLAEKRTVTQPGNEQTVEKDSPKMAVDKQQDSRQAINNNELLAKSLLNKQQKLQPEKELLQAEPLQKEQQALPQKAEKTLPSKEGLLNEQYNQQPAKKKTLSSALAAKDIPFAAATSRQQATASKITPAIDETSLNLRPQQDNKLDKNQAQTPLPSQHDTGRDKSFKLSVSISQQQTLQGEGITRQGIRQTEAILDRLQHIIAAGQESKTATIAITQTGIQAKSGIITMEDIATLRKDGQLPLTQAQIIPENGETAPAKTTSSNAKLFKILEENSPAPPQTQQHRQTRPQSEHIITRPLVNEANGINDRISHHIQAENRITVQDKKALPAQDISSPLASVIEQKTPKEEKIPASLMQTGSNEKEKQAETQPGKNNAASKISTPPANETLFSSDTNSGSFPGSQAGQTASAETPSTPAPTVTLPSGVVVREDEVVRQFIEKFQINGRNLESRINIRLNPKELGEIKIALAVKEKSIKANVVAQSQISQEILEKNLGKLKNMLENQGFDIEEINIITSDEPLAEFNLFEQEFAQHQQQRNKRTTSSSATAPDQEDTEQKTEQEDSINLMV